MDQPWTLQVFPALHSVAPHVLLPHALQELKGRDASSLGPTKHWHSESGQIWGGICVQSKSTNASKIQEMVSSTLQKLWSDPNATVSTAYLIILYFTLICSMPRAWQDSKVIASSAKRQQLHHNMSTPWLTKWDPQWHCCNERKSHLPLPPLHGSEASKNFLSNGWNGR